MTYRFIEEHKDQWPVRLLCETLEVSPAGYYAWRQGPRKVLVLDAGQPRNAPAAPGNNGTTLSWWKFEPSTPRSRPATAARACTRNSSLAVTPAASTRSPG